MNNSCYITPADKGGDIWFVYEPSGQPIGACSSREGAQQIASIANHGVPAARWQPAPRINAVPATQPITHLATASETGVTTNKPQAATLTANATARTDNAAPAAVVRWANAQWNAPRHRGLFWSLFNRWERLVGG